MKAPRDTNATETRIWERGGGGGRGRERNGREKKKKGERSVRKLAVLTGGTCSSDPSALCRNDASPFPPYCSSVTFRDLLDLPRSSEWSLLFFFFCNFCRLVITQSLFFELEINARGLQRPEDKPRLSFLAPRGFFARRFIRFRISRLNDSSCVNEHIWRFGRIAIARTMRRKCRSYIYYTYNFARAALFLQGFCNAFSFTLCTLPAGR